MNPAAFGQAVAAAAGLAVSPVAVATVILLLLSRRGRMPGAAFLVGWAGGIAVAVGVFAFFAGILPLRMPGPARAALAVVELVVGVVLVVLGAVQWLAGRRTAGRPHRVPAWLRAVDGARPVVAGAVGLAMAVNPPNLLLSLAGGIALGTAGLTTAGIAFSVVLFTVLASCTVLAPVVGHAVAAERLRQPLESLRSWLVRHSAPIVTVVLVAVGVAAIVHAIVAIRTG